MNQMVIEIEDDGGLKVDSSKMPGAEKDILKLLEELGKDVGGEVKVEKHKPGIKHTHHQHIHS